MVLHYTNGLFTSGVTRGNGETGEDITANIRTIRSVPLRIPVGKSNMEAPEKLVVRAEAFITKKEFEKLNVQILKTARRLTKIRATPPLVRCASWTRDWSRRDL